MSESVPAPTSRPIVHLTPILLTNSQVAAIVGMSERTIRALVTTGEFPSPKKIGKLSRWRRDDVEKWAASL